ncbi:MAG: hypothetical protein MJ178_03440 [Treponemataceae bacterium]|nr:hypothetical protein [Treponemataceae bacterium]
MKKTFFKVLLPAIIFGLLAVLTSCMYLFPVHYDTHTVIINLSNSRGRFVNADEAQAYSNYYEIRLYQYQNGERMETPILTKVLDGNDLSFTCDTGYYYLEIEAWAEKTGTVVTGRGSTENTESFDDGIKVTPGVFELSYEQRSVSVTVQMHATPEEEYPRWNITWDLMGGEWKQDYEAEETFDWRRMYPLTSMDASMSSFPTSADVVLQNGEQASALVGWYLTSDFSDAPITRYQQLPLQDVTLYARWASGIGIDTDITFNNVIDFALTSGEADSVEEKTVTATPAIEWPSDAIFTWYVDGLKQSGSGSSYTFLCPVGPHSVSCIVTSESTQSTGSESISVKYIPEN